MRWLIFFLFIFSCNFKEAKRAPSSQNENNQDSFIPKKEVVLILEFKKIPLDIEKKIITGLIPRSRLEIFDDYKSDYFKRLYRLSFEANLNFQAEILLKLDSIKFIKRVEPVFQIEDLSVKPNPQAKTLTNDLFFGYLWGLKNSGQTVYKDLDDIHLETLEGSSGIDIGWNEKINEQMKENVTVAVLDSGIDFEHPDLKENIEKNELECVNGNLPFKPKEDKDKNGYIGDCIGWNFTGKELGGDNRPTDDIGHGTHVAGIIAAVTNNKVGVSGISNKLKILPVKVLKKEDSASPGVNGPLSDRVAKGILFAIKRGVKVINLSLGWPIILDTNYLRETFKLALEQKITIVAASGNNNNSSPIFPCAYENVICVSSISVDGKISNFSNYGGQVDILAPGDNILSTFPSIKDPEIFFAKGYELKNGTSQSSPFVAGASAVLKSIFPDISEDELKARLLLSAKKINFHDEKYISGGLLQLEEAVNLKPRPLVIPILKELNSIPLSEGNQSIVIPLKIKNFWSDAKEITVTVKSLTENIQIEKQEFKFNILNKGQEEMIPLKGVINDLFEDHNFDFEVKISEGNNSSIFKQNIKLVSILGKDSKSIPLLGLSDTDLIKKDQYLFPKIKTVSDPLFLSKNPFYYTWEKQEGNASLKIFKFSNGEFKPIDNSIQIIGGNNILSVILLDANYDGKLDFFVRTISQDQGKQIIQYSYFNEEGKPLFGKYSNWSFTPESVVLDLNRINFLHFFPFKNEILGTIAIPVQLIYGSIPEIDQNPDPFVPKELRKSMHIYYFEPKIENDKVLVKTRIVDNWKFLKNIRSRIGLSFNDSIFLLESIPQNKFDLKNGTSKFLISAGKNYFTNSYIIKLKDNFDVDIKKLETDKIHFEGSYFYPITDLTHDVVFRNGLSLIGVYNDITLRSSGIEKDKLSYTTVYKQTRQADSLVGAMATYKKGNKSFSFFQTKGHLKVLIHENGKENIILSRPIIRFSFIPGELFSETFYPIIRGNYPALYVDTTQMSRNDVFILTLDDRGRLISPISYNLRIPDNCKSLNPSPQNGVFSFTLICQDKIEEKNFSIRYLEIK